MNYEELLHEYFDGGLGEQQEAVLFAALAHDAVLRQEFGDFMQLRNVARNEAAVALPPASLTAAVFSGLGYQTDSSRETAPAPVAIVPPAGGSVASLLPYAVTAFLSSVLTAFIVLLFIVPDAGEEKSNASTHVGWQQQSTQNTDFSSAGTGQTRYEETTQAKEAGTAKTTLSVARNSAHSVMASSGQEEQVFHSSEVTLPPITNVESVAPYEHISIASHSTNHYALASEEAIPSLFFFAEDIGQFDIALHSSSAVSFPSVDVPTQTRTLTAPLSVSVLRRLSDEHAIGADVGREAFAQEFTQMLHGEQVTVLQNPTLWWGAAAYRYTPESLRWENVAPFLQLSLGVTQVGPFGRARCGANWTPESRVMFSAGIEGSALAYPVEGSVFTTTKLGVFYGLGVRF